MNFQRGFFRVWVILSILFVIAVAIVSYTDVSREFEWASLDFSSTSTVMVPADCKLARGKAGTDYDTPDRWNGYAPHCWYQMPTFRRLFPEYGDLSDDVLTSKAYAKAGIELKPARPWRALGIALSIAFGVPLVVLALGAALGWAISGFRPKPT
jgi:hypothetical protein